MKKQKESLLLRSHINLQFLPNIKRQSYFVNNIKTECNYLLAELKG